MKYKYFGFFLALALVAFLIAQGMQTSTPPPETTQQHQDLLDSDKHFKNLAQKFNLLSDEEFKEYLELKDENQKYLKANQLLAKIFLVLMANAVIEPQENQKIWIEKTLQKGAHEKDSPVEEKKEIEVIIDPYKEKDEAIAPKKQKEGGNKFERFDDIFNDHKLNRLLDNDVLKEQWTAEKPLSAETDLQPIFLNHFEGYPGSYTGDYRFGAEQKTVSLELLPISGPADANIKALFYLYQNDGPIYIQKQFFIYHPRSHNHDSGGGSCRAIVLNDGDFQIHVIRLRDRNNLLMRMFKYPASGSPQKMAKYIGNVYLTSNSKNPTKIFYDSRGKY
ncbi:MAG: hypothetical protein A2X86_08295 [Bdellovibrionales bacterium GWA2_49_15]|nr:MAG: hypothetical protein A2X86_08295 [Bdellovibrionales bacterium GWA2_49_15]HAZ11239.1 hypothetical protein [Bdellovibrionales bacterium]